MRPNLNQIPPDLRRRLNAAHSHLLTLHKALLDHEKARYEKDHPPISSPGHFLQLLINDPFFAWLRPISTLAAQIDEFTESKSPTNPPDGEALLTTARTLLSGEQAPADFTTHYTRARTDSTTIAQHHTTTTHALTAK